MRVKKPLACIHCGRSFPRTSGAGLHCGEDCESDHALTLEFIHADLKAKGFEQDQEAPNVYRKGDSAVTVEEVKHVGMDETIRRHSQILESIASAKGTANG